MKYGTNEQTKQSVQGQEEIACFFSFSCGPLKITLNYKHCAMGAAVSSETDLFSLIYGYEKSKMNPAMQAHVYFHLHFV